MIPATPGWYKDAKCRGLDTRIFYAPLQSPITSAAKRICSTCPVQEQCRAAAVENIEQGIWGGEFFDRPR